MRGSDPVRLILQLLRKKHAGTPGVVAHFRQKSFVVFVSAASSLNKLSSRSAQDTSTAGMTHILLWGAEKLQTLLCLNCPNFPSFRAHYSNYELLFEISIKVCNFRVVGWTSPSVLWKNKQFSCKSFGKNELKQTYFYVSSHNSLNCWNSFLSWNNFWSKYN